MSNAVKFTESGEIVVRVAVEAGVRLRFVVEDTGLGIDAERAARLFEPFTQADQSTSRLYGGTGLGLAISRELVHQMGGEIGAEPREGGGSVFWFTAKLPAAATVRTPTGAGPEQWRRHLAPDANAPVVLVAEDNDVNRVVAAALLAKRGLRTAIACSGIEAVEMASARDYAAILMDCQMPRLDGYEATRVIRAAETGGRVPIIAMTAHAMRGDRERCLDVGMDDYISKPIRQEELDAVIARWVPGTTIGAGEEAAATTRSAPGSRDGLQIHNGHRNGALAPRFHLA